MNTIVQDRRLHTYLSSWASGTKFVISSYFFWRPGNEELQHNLLGLLRRILYQCLQNATDLTSTVRGPCLGSLPHAREFDWSYLELPRCLERLLRQQDVKLALFVDGLDEYVGDDLTLVRRFQRTSKNPCVKVCVASRPWPIFDTTFGDSPGLRLQDLTKQDLSAFIAHELGREYCIPRALTRQTANGQVSGRNIAE